MTTLTNFIESARYDLTDYETGLEFDERELVNYLNRMIVLVDSTLNSIDSDLLFGNEINIDCVKFQNYVNITDVNNNNVDSVQEVWLAQSQLTHITVPEMYRKRKWYNTGTLTEFGGAVVGGHYRIVTQTTLDYTTIGAADNNVGTNFTADAAGTLGSGDVLRVLSLVTPSFWALEGNHILFESGSDSAYTTLEINYKKKTRPLLQSYSAVFTAAVTDINTTAVNTFVTGDGRFQVSNSGGALPTGLSASTDYWMEFISPTTFYLCTTKSNAVGSAHIDITDTGSGEHTITHTEYMPFDSKWDNLFREMLVLHSKAKKEGQMSQPDSIFQEIFRKRAFE
jgi:hypothetical protein